MGRGSSNKYTAAAILQKEGKKTSEEFHQHQSRAGSLQPSSSEERRGERAEPYCELFAKEGGPDLKHHGEPNQRGMCGRRSSQIRRISSRLRLAEQGYMVTLMLAFRLKLAKINSWKDDVVRFSQH